MSAAPLADVASLLERLPLHGARNALSFYRGSVLEGRISHADLAARVDQMAGGLHGGLGVSPGDRVAILAPNGLQVPVLVLALLRLGAIVVPLNPGASVEDWTYILGHSGASGLCVTRELASRLPQGAHPSFTLHVEDAFDLAGKPPPIPSGLGDRIAVVLYTSGTTGNPKGVALRHRNLLANALSMARNFRLEATTQLTVLPLYHAHAFGFGLMTALSTGGHLVFTERLEPFSWAKVIRAESIEVSSVVPTLLPLLLASGIHRQKVPTLRHLLVSSAPLAMDLAREFETRTGIPLVHGWGLSEYTNFACCLPAHQTADEHAGLMFGFEVPSIGPALEGTEVRVVDASGAPVQEGAKGELVIRGHSTMLGYFRDPENSARAIDADGWLHSGDEGFFRMSGGRPIYFVTGRIKELIIRDSEKFSPLRLERRLAEAVPQLSGCLVVLGFPHREHGEEVGAYLELETLDGALRAQLDAAIQAMPVPERPKVVLHGAEAIPRTHTGKVQRRRMQPWFQDWIAHRGPTVIRKRGRAAAVSS